MNKTFGIILQIFLSCVFGLISGYFTYTMTTDYIWGGFVSFIVLAILILNKILENDKYLLFIVSFLITTTISAGFLLIKVKPKSIVKTTNVNTSNEYFNILKSNSTGNDNLFFWSLFTASVITILGGLIAKYLYTKMKNTSGYQGPKGFKGPRGDNGDPSVPLKNKNGVAYLFLLQDINKEIENYMSNSDTPIDYIEGDKHLKNLLILQNLHRIIYSNDFNKEYIDTLYSDVLNNSRLSNKKCDKENRALKHAIDKVIFDAKKWIQYILSYKNGLKFLRSEFATSQDWEVLYLKADKTRGLPPNPIKKLETGIPSLETYIDDYTNKWNWGTCRK